MNIVTIIGVSVLGIITIISVFLGLKAYRGYKLSKYSDHEDEILGKVEKDEYVVGSISKGVHVGISIGKAVNSMSNKTNHEEVKNLHSGSSLRSAAISFNKREQDKERGGSNDVWSPTTTQLFASSLESSTNNHCDTGSIFDNDNSSHGSNFSTSNDSGFSSGSDSGGWGCD